MKSDVKKKFSLIEMCDFLILCLNSGMNCIGALNQIPKMHLLKDPTYQKMIEKILNQYSVGVPIYEAFEGCQGTSDDFDKFIDAVVFSQKFGNSLCDNLKNLSLSLQHSLSQHVDELAAQASTKMLFPLLFFIFPTIFVVFGASLLWDFMDQVIN